MTLANQLTDYVNAAFSGLWVLTHEPDEAEREIARLAKEYDWRLATWDIAAGLRLPSQDGEQREAGVGDPLAALRALPALADPEGTTLLVLHQFHRFLNNPEVIQTVFRQLVAGKSQRTFLVVLAAVAQIPIELEKLFVVLEHPLPDRDALGRIVTELTTDAPEALPDDIRSHIKCVVARRDRESVRAELEELFAPAVPSPADTQALTQAFDGILDWGVRAARERGQAGGADFANLLDHWVTIKRKRGGDDFTRALLDHLSYQCKQAFYLCYTNLWISLIPSLREHRGLDEISERFLRFWHMQNQPVELPDGRVLPDVFGGQVLALHPLSGFIMQDPALSAVAGNFFATDAYTATFTRGQAAACAEYWALVEVILTAAHLYRRANGEQEQARSQRTRRGVEGLAAPAGGPCAEALLERLAEARGWFCPSCGGPLRHVGVDRGAGSDAATLEYACRSCGTPVRKAQHYEELRSSLA
jgi:hypothetical protein